MGKLAQHVQEVAEPSEHEDLPKEIFLMFCSSDYDTLNRCSLSFSLTFCSPSHSMKNDMGYPLKPIFH